MEINIARIPKGTKFIYKGEEFIVTERNYPWVTAKCITEPNEYEGYDLLFGGAAEIVTIDDNSDTIEFYFKEDKNGFQLKEKLIHKAKED